MTPERSPLSLLAFQPEIPATPTPEERDWHVARMIDVLHDALRQQPADLVVLPELSTISYDRATFEQLDRLAEPLDGPSVDAFSQLAAATATTVTFGMPRTHGAAVRITQVVIGPDGETIGHYDKLHAAQFGHSMEKEFFDRGDHLLVFECAGMNVAPIVCYDIRFPELCRTLVTDCGAELILHCSAFSRDESFPSWHSFVTARAMENQVPVLGLSRAGHGWGGSMFCGPWVDDSHPPTRFPEHAEALLRLSVDPGETDRVRSAYTFLDDRLEDYGGLPRT